MGGRGCAGRRGVKGGKWDNCNSIINKIYLKKENKHKRTFIKKKRNIQSHKKQGSIAKLFYPAKLSFRI